MKQLRFNVKSFLLTIFLFILLSTAWSILCIETNEFTNSDKGLVSGFGFLLLLPLAIFLGQRIKGIKWLGFLVGSVLLIFLIASLAIGALFGLTTNSMVVYAIANSFFVAMAMVFCLNKAAGIPLKWPTIFLTFLFLLAAYALIDRYDEEIYLYYHISPRVTLFNVFQLSLIVPLALGMNIKKVGTTSA